MNEFLCVGGPLDGTWIELDRAKQAGYSKFNVGSWETRSGAMKRYTGADKTLSVLIYDEYLFNVFRKGERS